MAKITGYQDIPLGDLKIGKGQIRTIDVGKDIEQLAASIEKQGLLQPILVCESEEDGKWEILLGQRRFLAHRMLKRETIHAGVLDGRVDEGEAKAISITENLIRRNLHGTELIDGITFLYNMYGSEEAVYQKTGIPKAHIRDYVKYPRLKRVPQLKQLVDDQDVDVRVALRALDAADVGDGSINEEHAVKLAKEMASMSDVQRKKLVQERKADPEMTVDDAIERARGPSQIKEIVVQLTGDAHSALQRFSNEENVTQNEAAATFIQEGLIDRGFLGK